MTMARTRKSKRLYTCWDCGTNTPQDISFTDKGMHQKCLVCGAEALTHMSIERAKELYGEKLLVGDAIPEVDVGN